MPLLPRFHRLPGKTLLRLALPWALTLAASTHAQAQAQDSAVILQYHHIDSRTPPQTSTRPEIFAAQLRHLEEENYSVLPLEELLARLRRGESLPARSVAITFDDGFASVYESAFPLLEERGWPFTLFVNPASVGSNPALYLSWEQLREMAAAGASVANHGMSHVSLPLRQAGESEADWRRRIQDEIETAEARIQQETGQSHRLLAYPYGEYAPELNALVEELGYVGLGQQSGPVSACADFSALPRFGFSGLFGRLEDFPLKVASLAFCLEARLPESPLTDSPNPSVSLRFRPGDYDLARLSCFHEDQLMQLQRGDGDWEVLLRSTTRSTSRRFRYNCTAPGPEGRYYWLSIPWTRR